MTTTGRMTRRRYLEAKMQQDGVDAIDAIKEVAATLLAHPEWDTKEIRWYHEWENVETATVFTVIEGTVKEGPIHCGECGGDMPVGAEAFVLIDRVKDETTINCGSCYRDED